MVWFFCGLGFFFCDHNLFFIFSVQIPCERGFHFLTSIVMLVENRHMFCRYIKIEFVQLLPFDFFCPRLHVAMSTSCQVQWQQLGAA